MSTCDGKCLNTEVENCGFRL